MKRRTWLHLAASAVAAIPLGPLRLLAQPRELTPEAIATLRAIAPTVLPASLGTGRVDGIVNTFAEWTRGYREGVPLQHGYGHPRLVRTGPTPASRYIAQLAELDAAARAHNASWDALDLEARRSIVDAALTKAGVNTLPARPSGQHVVSDLMALYFRSTEANDDCYSARIGREVCRPIQITTKKPEPLAQPRA